jgi:hypothetical protein
VTGHPDAKRVPRRLEHLRELLTADGHDAADAVGIGVAVATL